MPTIDTQQFGTIEYSEDAVFEFPAGLPGFEQETRFVCVERPALRPLVFLQSTNEPGLCFITVPSRSVDPSYELQLAGEDYRVLGESGTESLACLAIVCLTAEGDATANLLGPIVLSKATMRGIQAVRDDLRYSATHLLQAAGEPARARATASNAASTSLQEAEC